MEPDFALVFGIVLSVFAVPSVLSAMSDRRAPRASAVLVLIAGGLILYAVQMQPGGYEMNQIPDVFMRVVRQLL
jgi:hypothetical protein